MPEAKKRKLESYLKGRDPKEVLKSLIEVTNYIITNKKTADN